VRHDLTLEGSTLRLRPVTDADAEFIVALRGDPNLSRFLHATSTRVQDQLDWLRLYYERPDDYYFVIERRGSDRPEGLVALYDIDTERGSGEWGRWILKAGSLAAAESAWLIYRCAFERLELREVYCRTVAENRSVVSFHDSCGLPGRTLLPAHFALGGRRLDAIEHRMDREAWNEVRPRLEKVVQLAARRLART
jgi:RimJ/RimL family protein N-acetyltransferase